MPGNSDVFGHAPHVRSCCASRYIPRPVCGTLTFYESCAKAADGRLPETETTLKLTSKHLIIIIAVLVVALGVVVSGVLRSEDPLANIGDRVVKGTTITQVIGDAVPSASVETTVQVRNTADPAAGADEIFSQLTGSIPGAAVAIFDTATMKVTVRYDSAQASPAAVRKPLILGGYAPISAEDVTPATPNADQTKQSITVEDLGGTIGFEPALIYARAGIPLEIVFTGGKECRTSIIFPELGTPLQNIENGATVELGALEAGSYGVQCSQGGLEAIIVVQ